MRIDKRFFILTALIFLLSSCAGITHLNSNRSIAASPAVKHCLSLINRVDSTVTRAGVHDRQSAEIRDFPYLRTNRFLSDFRQQLLSDTAFKLWISEMQDLALTEWKVELANLSVDARNQILVSEDDRLTSPEKLHRMLKECSILLTEILVKSPNLKQALRQNARVPDSYNTWQRILGVYPLTGLFFRAGISRWHTETKATYALPRNRLATEGKLKRYALRLNEPPMSEAEITRILTASGDSDFPMPRLNTSVLRRLIATYAPVIEVDVVSDNDKIGAPHWRNPDNLVIDTSSPTLYWHMSYTRVGSSVLPQINYTFWFPARPKESTFDLLGGNLDGVTWRLTLLPDGKPWLFDTIHNCGCYHLFFPTQNSAMLSQKSTFTEPAFSPQQVLGVSPENQVVVRIAHSTHYINRVYTEPRNYNRKEQNFTSYMLRASDELRSVPVHGNQRRSIYGEDGIIRSSQRAERFLFWPMGIPRAGAMRQWGHHATAFVGRRHFDDARLFENLFDF